MHHWTTWTMVNFKSSLQPSHMCRGFVPRLGFIPSRPRLNWSSCFRVQIQFFNIVISSFSYVHCINAMLNVVSTFLVFASSGRIRSRCEERVRDRDQQHRRSVQVHQRTRLRQPYLLFWAYLNPMCSKCFESPPNIICMRFNCLLSIARVILFWCMPSCCRLYILIQCS